MLFVTFWNHQTIFGTTKPGSGTSLLQVGKEGIDMTNDR